MHSRNDIAGWVLYAIELGRYVSPDTATSTWQHLSKELTPDHVLPTQVDAMALFAKRVRHSYISYTVDPRGYVIKPVRVVNNPQYEVID